tara:strand:- start:4840 stop:5046 length:207 start_codon:yes stop_codon:yes gene_type:complete
MAEYHIVVAKNADKQSVVNLFDNVIDPLVASDRVFSADVAEEDVESYRANPNIDSIEALDESIMEEDD